MYPRGPVVQHKFLVLSSAPDAPARARRELATTLAAWQIRSELLDDAVLIVSELVSNAVLHAQGAESVAALLFEDCLRLEVGDRDDFPPQPHHYADTAPTGRGLGLVATLSRGWGWEPREAGKTVWAELALMPEPSGSGAGSGLSGSHLAAGGAGSDLDADHGANEVLILFPRVPVADYLALQEQNDAVHRDIDLLLLGIDDDPPVMAEGLLEAARQMRSTFVGARVEHRAAVEAAAARGETSIDLQGWMDGAVAASAVEYLNVIEELERFASQGLLLVSAPPASVAALRRWFVEQALAQMVKGLGE
jgi:anti-sigma regulatory factor (Ser/Thr protein kinase)